jgi:hypothetical protein
LESATLMNLPASGINCCHVCCVRDHMKGLIPRWAKAIFLIWIERRIIVLSDELYIGSSAWCPVLWQWNCIALLTWIICALQAYCRYIHMFIDKLLVYDYERTSHFLLPTLTWPLIAVTLLIAVTNISYRWLKVGHQGTLYHLQTGYIVLFIWKMIWWDQLGCPWWTQHPREYFRSKLDFQPRQDFHKNRFWCIGRRPWHSRWSNTTFVIVRLSNIFRLWLRLQIQDWITWFE